VTWQERADSNRAWQGFVPTDPKPSQGLPGDRNMFYGDLHTAPPPAGTPTGAVQITRYFACYGSAETLICLGAAGSDGSLLRWLPEVNGWVVDPTVSGTFPFVRAVDRVEADALRGQRVGAFSDEGRLHLYLSQLPGRV
jgi:hypothetical protein